MTAHVGLLRAVNLAGHNAVPMSDLRQMLADLGLQEPRSLLQSGNVLFRTSAASTSKLERLLEEAAAKRFGLETAFFVRDAREWAAAIAGNPFTAEAERDPGHLLMLALREAPGRSAVAALQRAIAGREVVRAAGRHAYIVYPDGVGRSKLTMRLIERTLGTAATGRNWNTVMKIGAGLGV